MAVTYAIPRNYEARQKNVVHSGHKVTTYDYDNAYPQRVYEVLMASSTGVACSSLYAKFIRGNGLSDKQLSKQPVNRKGQTLDKMLSILSRDYARFGYFVLHVNYNLNYEVAEFTRIDPRYARYGLPDSNEYVSKIAVYNDWARDNYKIIKRKEIEYIDVYNPNPEAVKAQIELSGGIQRYKGQVLMFTGELQNYVRAPHDSVLNDLEVDAKIPQSSLTELDKGFMAKQLLFLPFEFDDDETRGNFKNNLKNVQGAQGESLFVIEHTLGKEDQAPKLEAIDHTYTDLKFQSTKDMTRQDIYRAYNQPGILHTDYKDSGMSSSDQIRIAFEFYNQHTSEERDELLTVLKGLMARFSHSFEGLEELEIVEREFIVGKGSLSDRLGKESMKELLTIISGSLPVEQKKQILINIFGIEEDKASLLVDSGDNKIEEDGNNLSN